MSLLEAKNVGYRTEGRVILENISVSIDAGEIITVIGPNGGGKTTFARICIGVLTPTEGEIQRSPELTMGYVPQRLKFDPTLPMTVNRFMNLGNRVDTQAVTRALNAVETAHLDGQQMAQLSGGELQRVLLARALMQEPDILVLDEPVQGVDFSGEAQLYNLISRVRDEFECAVMLISHDLHIVLGASDQVLCLNRHICCAGVPEKVSNHPEFVRMFGKDSAAAYGIYAHKHDHTHGLSGEPEVRHEGSPDGE